MQGREEGRDPVATAQGQPQSSRQWPISRRANFVCEDAHKDVELVKNLYSALIEAKKVCGEPVEDFSFPRFHRLIASQADGLKERLGCERVSFSIDVEGGHVSFKARGEKRLEATTAVIGNKKGDRDWSPFFLCAYRTRRPEAVSGFAKASRGDLHLGHFFGLWSFRALRHFELDFLTLFESLEAVALNGAVVNEDV